MLSINLVNKFFIEVYSEQVNIINPQNERLIKRIGHKIRHSYGVLATVQRIISLDDKLKNKNMEFRKKLEIAALLHDIGRFYQHDGNDTIKSQDFEHGKEGYKILLDNGIFDSSILLAVKYHNKLNLEGIYQEEEFLQLNDQQKEEAIQICKAIRDADKLQNLEYVIFDGFRGVKIFNNITSDIGSDKDEGISNKVLEDFIAKKMVKNEDVTNNNDFLIKILSRTFDINYKGSIQILKNNGLREFTKEYLQSQSLHIDQIDKICHVLDEVLE